MQVCVRVFGHVIVEDDVYTLDVHPAPEQVGRDEDTLLEVLELLVATQSILHQQINQQNPDQLKQVDQWILLLKN